MRTRPASLPHGADPALPRPGCGPLPSQVSHGGRAPGRWEPGPCGKEPGDHVLLLPRWPGLVGKSRPRAPGTGPRLVTARSAAGAPSVRDMCVYVSSREPPRSPGLCLLRSSLILVRVPWTFSASFCCRWCKEAGHQGGWMTSGCHSEGWRVCSRALRSRAWPGSQTALS